MRRFLAILLLAIMPASVMGQTGILPTARYTDWTQAGVPGGIPSGSWTQCGATLNPGASAATISGAMAHTGAGYTGCAANTFVQLGSGTFSISGICFKNLPNGDELRGNGANLTILNITSTVSCQGGGAVVGIGFENNNGESTCCGNTAVSISAGLSQGSTTVTIANAATLGLVANSSIIVIDSCDTGFSGATTASNTYAATCASGSSIDNGGVFDASDAYNPTANDSSTGTVTGGTALTGTGFSSAFGSIVLIAGLAYPIASVNSATSITLASAAPNGAGQSVSFPTGISYNASNGHVARNRRGAEEFHLVSSCSPSCSNAGSTVVTLATPIIHAVFGSNPEAWSIQPNTNIGIRNLTINTPSISANPGLDFNDLQNCWVVGVEVSNAQSQGIGMYGVNGCEIQSSYVYNAGQSVLGTDPSGNDPSGIDLNGSHILVDNNIIQFSRIGVIFNGPTSGSVIGYNYIVNAFEGGGDLWGACWDGHQSGTEYNLWEGNVCPQVYQDQTHGGKLFETFYRNLVQGWESCSNGNCTVGGATQKNANVYSIGDLSGNRYDNIVNNILGTPGIFSNAYVFTNANQFIGNTTGIVYNLASGNPNNPTGGFAGGPIPIDPIVAPSLIRWGNWDAFNSATLECTAVATPIAACLGDERGTNAPTFPGLASPSTSFPASFYLSGRPSWWASTIPFPAIGSDVTGGNVGQCGGTVNTSGQFALVPATAASQCAGHGLNSAWSGHVNAIPAMSCFLTTMSGQPDGVGSALTFNANTCFAASVSNPVAAPVNPVIVKFTKKEHPHDEINSEVLSPISSLTSSR